MSGPALRLAVRRGLILLPVRDLGGVTLDGRVLRYDPALPSLRLARGVLDAMRNERQARRGQR